MPARTDFKHVISVDEYLAGEQHSELRHEYIDGQVYAMTGASRAHGLIVNALAFALTPAARRKGCQLFTSDMKLPQDREPFFTRAPCLVVEVLSESTARIDRHEKLLACQSLPSLQTYLLLEQDVARAELYPRANGWRVEYVEQGSIRIDCLDMGLPLAEVYADVQVRT